MLMNIFIATLYITQIVSAQTWNRRIYYNDNSCKGAATRFYNDYFEKTPCPGGRSTDGSQPWPCESKSTLAGVLSSEATLCTTVSASNLSDTPFFPTSGVNAAKAIEAANYFYYNTFSGTDVTDCSLKEGKVTIQSNGFVADGKCYATESDTFFKVTCNENEGVVSSCSDSQCTSCRTNTISNKCSSVNEGFRNAFCVSAATLLSSNDGEGSANKTQNGTNSNNGNKSDGYALNSINANILFMAIISLFF